MVQNFMEMPPDALKDIFTVFFAEVMLNAQTTHLVDGYATHVNLIQAT